MSIFFSRNKSDVQAELKHAPLYYLAMCPMSAMHIIADVMYETITTMMEHNYLSYPTYLVEGNDPFRRLSGEESENYSAQFLAILDAIRDGFPKEIPDYGDKGYEQYRKDRTLACSLLDEFYEALWI